MGFAKSRTQLTNFHFKDLEGGQTSPRQEGGRGGREGGEATDRALDPFQPHPVCGQPTWHLDFSNIERKSSQAFM